MASVFCTVTISAEANFGSFTDTPHHTGTPLPPSTITLLHGGLITVVTLLHGGLHALRQDCVDVPQVPPTKVKHGDMFGLLAGYDGSINRTIVGSDNI